MIIVMSPSATKEDIAKVENKLKSMGLQAHLSVDQSGGGGEGNAHLGAVAAGNVRITCAAEEAAEHRL